MTKFNIRLPHKMSALLRVALADLDKTEQMSNYEIHMGLWHSPWFNKTICNVCLAGCVLAQHGFPRSRQYHASSVDNNLNRKLSAINALRTGDIHLATFFLHLKDSPIDSVNITPYEEDPKAFKRDLGRLVVRLEKHGL